MERCDDSAKDSEMETVANAQSAAWGTGEEAELKVLQWGQWIAAGVGEVGARQQESQKNERELMRAKRTTRLKDWSGWSIVQTENARL